MTRRPLRTAVSILLIGVGINAALAQFAGQLPLGERERPFRYIRAGNDAPEVHGYSGLGREVITWRVLGPEAAAIWQGIRSPARPSVPDKRRTEPQYDPPSSVPGWSRVWSADARAAASALQSSGVQSGHLVSPPTELGLGFPFISFAVSLEPRALLPNQTPRPIFRGGVMTDPARAGRNDRLTAWAWQPVWPGVALGSLTWACAVGATLLAFQSLRSRRRRRAGRCPACGYTLAGLPENLPCPECGRQQEASPAQPGR